MASLPEKCRRVLISVFLRGVVVGARTFCQRDLSPNRITVLNKGLGAYRVHVR
jgi:hypothetical protein